MQQRYCRRLTAYACECYTGSQGTPAPPGAHGEQAMADLSVEILGLRFANPVLPAAGPTVWDGNAMLSCVAGGAGGIVSKTISTSGAIVPQPCMAEVRRASMLNTELWAEYPPEQYIEHEYAIARQAGVPLIISLGYTPDQIAALAPRVRPFADALELSTHYVGNDPRPMQQAIIAAKRSVSVPVLVKMSPFRDVVSGARAALEAGADGLVAVNSFGPAFGLDLESALPVMGSKDGYGWLSGPAIKPLGLRCVYDIARITDKPIFAVGGISRGLDAIEYIMAGASAVQVCTAAILRGPGVYGRSAREISDWLDKHGHRSVNEIRRLAVDAGPPLGAWHPVF
jgi:dihydroorotate dehydrogenase (NAD+) catalytic subunit